MSTEYEELVGEEKLLEYRKILNVEIEQAKTDIVVGQDLIADVDRRIARIDERLAEIYGA